MRLRHVGACLSSLLLGLLLAISLLALVNSAQAAPATTRPYPGPAPCHTTLQACLNSANSGDVIQIAAGTFTESFTLSRAVSLVGAGAELTILRAEPAQRLFSITYTTAHSIVIADLTITGGSLTGASSVTDQGGGVYVRENTAPIAFDGVIFRDNLARDGGGLYTRFNVTLSLADTQFLNNTAAHTGGGLSASFDVTLTLTNSLFAGNVASTGGGLFNFGYTTLQSVDFLSNTATGGQNVPYGGGAYSYYGQVIDSRFEYNHSAGGQGGGLWTAASLVSATVFASNTATYGAGLQANALVMVTDTTFVNNQASVLGGGAYFVHGAALTGVTATNNQAADGGAFYFSNLSQQAWIEHSTLQANSATSTTGTGGIVLGYMRATTQSVEGLVNTTLVGTGAADSRGVQVGLGRALALTGTSISGYAIPVVSLGAQTMQPTGYFTETAGTGICGLPAYITYTRPLTIWYGSLSAGGVPILSLASASERTHSSLPAAAIWFGRPASLEALLVPWADPLLDIFSPVVSGTGLNAEANLRAALAGAWRPAAYHGVRFDAPVAHGQDTVHHATYGSFDVCGEDFQEQTLTYQTQVEYYELNATAVHRVLLPLLMR